MKKIVNWCLASVLTIGFSGVFTDVNAREKTGARGTSESYSAEASVKKSEVMSDAVRMEAYANQLYKEINFGKHQKISKDVFVKAFQGYLNLKQSGQLDSRRGVVSICDFSLSANVPRLWVIDLDKKKVLFNTLVAHGQGSGEEFATAFSNIEGSHQSSMGFFVTTNTYYGDKGYSLKLEGKDVGYNCQAFSRAIVIHAADYVSYDFIRSNNRLGRSWGCPSLPVALNRPIIDVIKGGTALFIYSDNKKYLASSKWLRKYPNIDASEIIKPVKDNTMLAEVVSPVKVNTDSIQQVPKPKVESKPIPIEAYFQ